MTVKTGWREVQLHEVSRPKQWQTIKKAEMTDSGYPVYGANGVIGRYHSFNHAEPTILIGCRGSCGAVNVTESEAWVTGNAMALDELDTDEVDFRFLVYALKADGLQDAVTGTSQPQITQTSLKRVRIPLPPIEEQRRIATVLDATDALRAKRRQALAKLDTLTQAIFIDMFGDPRLGIAEHLADHVHVVTKGTTPTSVGFDFVESGVPFVRVQDLAGGTVLIDEIELFISNETHRALRRSILKPRDVLVSIAGTIGRIAVVPDAAPEMNCNQAVALVRTAADLTPTYLQAWMNTDHAQEQMRGSRVTGTISNLSLTSIRNLQLPVPPLADQEKFAARFSDVQQLGEWTLGHAAGLDSLFSSLQQRAFRGDL